MFIKVTNVKVKVLQKDLDLNAVIKRTKRHKTILGLVNIGRSQKTRYAIGP